MRELEEKHGAPGVKQQLAAVRMLFDWLVTGQTVPMNPAAAVRGPKHVVTTGKTPVLYKPEWRKLFDSIPTDTMRDLRDRALIGTLTYSFARVGAALNEGRRRAAARFRLGDPATRKRRQGTHHGLSPRVGCVAARLHRQGRYR